MFDKLGNLGFVIGIFFVILSLILVIGGLLSSSLAYPLNFYTGFAFFLFGMAMIFFNRQERSNEKPE